jgi:hypothetical protein
MIIDVHCHYTFTRLREAANRGAAATHFDPRRAADAQPDGAAERALHPDSFASCISPRATKRLAWRGLQRLLGLDPRLRPGSQLDDALAGVYRRHLDSPGPVERFVLLAFDAYHDGAGERPPLPESSDEPGSDIYTSNELVRAVCAARPDRFLFGASVHPYRPDAVARVEQVFRDGACLLKWIPLHQNIDIRDARALAVLRKCADLGLPLLVHYNEEFTLATQHPEFRPIGPLLDVLRRLRRDGCMPPVIVAHVATPVTPLGAWGSFEELVIGLLGEFADAPLYADISALAAFSKVRFLRRLAQMQELHPKLLFGSDFPVPPAAYRLRRELGADYSRVIGDPSWPQQYCRIFRAAGFNEIVFHRAAEILPNVR